MDSYQKVYYVYTHIDPVTQELMYVGKGTRGRAWWMEKSRNKEHYDAITQILDTGNYTMDDIVTIEEKGLTEKEAYVLEEELINELEPPLNRPYGMKSSITEQQLDEMLKLRKEDKSYSFIADVFNVSTMTVYRQLKKRR